MDEVELFGYGPGDDEFTLLTQDDEAVSGGGHSADAESSLGPRATLAESTETSDYRRSRVHAAFGENTTPA